MLGPFCTARAAQVSDDAATRDGDAAAKVPPEDGGAVPEDEIAVEEDRTQKLLELYGALRGKVVDAGKAAYGKVADLHLLDRVPERSRLAAIAKKGATFTAAVGLKVVSTVATGAAKMSSDDRDRVGTG